MNTIVIIGNLTRDPEYKTTENGTPVCTFTVAVNRKEGQDGRKVDFYRVTTWRAQAENCQKYLAKGRKVAAVGSLSLESYKDKEGNTKYSLELQASRVDFLTPKNAAVDVPRDPATGFVQVDNDELPF